MAVARKVGPRLPALAVTTACFIAADVLRGTRVRAATAASLAGWVLLLATTLSWARAGMSRARFSGIVARVLVLAGVAAGVLLAYLERSHVLEAGTHVDAVYTWVGLQWALALNNPITFIGSTPSYPQSPLMLLSHAPGMAVGFAALGPLALHLGILVTVAGLLAVMTVAIAPGTPLWKQGAAVALAAGCVSTRFFVQGYDAVGYVPVGVCLGLALVAALAIEDTVTQHRLIGGLVGLALLHSAYLGIAMALPMCAAWLLLRRHPVRWTRQFASENAILLVLLSALAVTIATNPNLILHRLRDVAGGGHRVSLLRETFARAPRLLAPLLPGWWWNRLGASWLLVDLPPLAGPVLPALAAMWVCSWIVAPEGVRATTRMVLFLAMLAVLSFLQHVLTGPEDYRDFPLVVGMSVAALLFVLRAPALSGAQAWIAWPLACLIAVLNFGDVAQLEGHRHLTDDYAPREVSLMETLRRDVAVRTPAAVGASRLLLVLEDILVPIRRLYLEVFEQRGFAVTPLAAGEFCQDRESALRTASAISCDAFVLASAATMCDRQAYARKDVSVVLRYETACPRTPDEATGRWRVLLPNGGAPPL